jgi:hypothetical protein
VKVGKTYDRDDFLLEGFVEWNETEVEGKVELSLN